VLLEDSHSGQAYTLTGPETLTRVELARQLGDAIGRNVRFIEVSRDEAVGVLAATLGGDAAWYIDNVLAGFGEQPVAASRTVEEIIGRAATTFARWARDHADRLRGPAASS